MCKATLKVREKMGIASGNSGQPHWTEREKRKAATKNKKSPNVHHQSGSIFPVSTSERVPGFPACFPFIYPAGKLIHGLFFVHSLQLGEVHLQNPVLNYYLQK